MKIAIIVFIFWTVIFLGLLTGCENVRQSVGVSAKPLSEKWEEGMG